MPSSLVGQGVAVMGKRAIVAGMMAMAALAGAVPAQAQAEGDGGKRLGQCLVDKSTGIDRVNLMRWLMASWAQSERLKDMVRIEPAVREKADREMAALVTRMLTVDCVEFAKPVLKSHDSAAMRDAFRAFGEIAGGEIARDPQGGSAMTNFAQFMDNAAMAKAAE